MSDDERLIDLESRIAYQDETLRVLSDAVASQQKQIDQLQGFCRQLLERLKARAQDGGGSGESFSAADEVPPHY